MNEPTELQKAIKDCKRMFPLNQPFRAILEAANQLEVIQQATGTEHQHLQFSLQLLTRAEKAEKQLESTRAENARMREALKVIWADCRALKVEWFEKEGLEMCVAVINNLRKHSDIGLSTPCKHLKVTDGRLGDEGYVVICNDCGQDLAPNRSTPPTTTENSKENVK